MRVVCYVYAFLRIGKVGIALNINWCEPATTSAEDRASCENYQQFNVSKFHSMYRVNQLTRSRIITSLPIVSGNASGKICSVSREPHDERNWWCTPAPCCTTAVALHLRRWLHVCTKKVNLIVCICICYATWRSTSLFKEELDVFTLTKPPEWINKNPMSSYFHSCALCGDIKRKVPRNFAQFMAVEFLLICSTAYMRVKKSCTVLKSETYIDIP
jgi:hypothetical protein